MLLQNGEQGESEKSQFLAALQSSLEIFVNRMRSNSQRGRPIANDSSVQSLFTVISNMHPQLLKYQQEMEDSRAYYESLQDKLTQLRDAREALDALREEHREKRRREMEELERQRQIQLMQKLEVMRQKKHEYLEMQRQLALQRLQEQEREMAMRFEQQKQLTHMRQMQAYGYPQMYGQQQPGMGGPPQPGTVQGAPPGAPTMMPPPSSIPHTMYPPGQQSSEGSPVHQLQGYGQQAPPPQGMAPPPGGIPPMQQTGMGPGGPGEGQMQQQMYQGGVPPQGLQQPPPANMAPPPANMAPPPGNMAPPPASMAPPPGNMAPPPNSMGQNFTPQMSGVYQPPGLSTDGGQMPTTAGAGYSSLAPGATMPYDPSQPSMGYSMHPGMMDYNTFNMQSMANTLPTNQQPGGYAGPAPPPGPAHPAQYLPPPRPTTVCPAPAHQRQQQPDGPAHTASSAHTDATSPSPSTWCSRRPTDLI